RPVAVALDDGAAAPVVEPGPADLPEGGAVGGLHLGPLEAGAAPVGAGGQLRVQRPVGDRHQRVHVQVGPDRALGQEQRRGGEAVPARVARPPHVHPRSQPRQRPGQAGAQGTAAGVARPVGADQHEPAGGLALGDQGGRAGVERAARCGRGGDRSQRHGGVTGVETPGRRLVGDERARRAQERRQAGAVAVGRVGHGPLDPQARRRERTGHGGHRRVVGDVVGPRERQVDGHVAAVGAGRARRVERLGPGELGAPVDEREVHDATMPCPRARDDPDLTVRHIAALPSPAARGAVVRHTSPPPRAGRLGAWEAHGASAVVSPPRARADPSSATRSTSPGGERGMHPDLPHEQAYFDRALALRDRQQARLAHAPALAANPKAALELRKRVSRFGLTDPDEAVAFGRIDTEDDRWYIGKSAIWDDDNELVVVNWQAPIAAPFYTATPERPEGLVSRRLFRCTGNQIREIEDTVFRSVQRAVEERRAPEPVVTDALLESLGSARSGELREIVATIQASQYDVISRPLDQLLVVQGGPGTGKTVVGLHRVSWLLYNHRDRLDAADVLLVGPNPAFIRYVAAVLPSLGDEAVVQLPLRALGPRVRIGRVDPPEVRRLKGDRRLLRVILRGLRNRQRVEAVPVRVTAAGRTVELDGRRVATRARQLAGRPHNEGHRMLRAFLCAEARAALREAGAGEVDAQGEAARDIDAHLARVWPRLTPQAFLVELLSSRRQLLAAAAGTLTEDEMAMLALPSGTQVASHQWSVDDVPLLDPASALTNAATATYEPIGVDEARDVSPMQLESVRRRSRTGTMTVRGDCAQGTSPWAHRAWDEIVQVLRHERVAATVVELDYGYRLPAEVHEVAMRLLPAIAPDLARPQALRSSGHEVAVTAAGEDDLPARTVEAVRAAADAG